MPNIRSKGHKWPFCRVITVILGHKLKLFVRDGKKMTKMIDKLKLPADKKDQITIKETDIFKPENLDLTGKIHRKLCKTFKIST